MRYKKSYRYKKKRPLFKKQYFWLALLFLLVAGTLVYFLFFSYFFQIKNINLSGEEKVPREEILFLVEENLEKKILFIGTKSVWSISAGDMRSKLLQGFPQLAGVEFNRDFPDTLNVTVRERIERAVWCGNGCFLMDGQGIIFEEFTRKDSSLPVLKVEGVSAEAQPGENIIEQALLAKILSIKAELKEKVGLETAEALVVSKDRLNIKTGEGWQIYFNLAEETDRQIQKLSLVLEKEISPQKRNSLEYIDLRFTRVYYK